MLKKIVFMQKKVKKQNNILQLARKNAINISKGGETYGNYWKTSCFFDVSDGCPSRANKPCPSRK